MKATDADIWVVMLVGQGAPPAAKIEGDGLATVLSVSGRKVRLDAAKDRIVAE